MVHPSSKFPNGAPDMVLDSHKFVTFCDFEPLDSHIKVTRIIYIFEYAYSIFKTKFVLTLSNSKTLFFHLWAVGRK